MLPQRFPGDLVCTGDQHHGIFPLTDAEHDAADHLVGVLVAFCGGLLDESGSARCG